MTTESLLLPLVIDAIGEAATMLGAESRRPAGPRGGGHKAKIDTEIEYVLAERLIAFLPALFVGEEPPGKPVADHPTVGWWTRKTALGPTCRDIGAPRCQLHCCATACRFFVSSARP